MADFWHRGLITPLSYGFSTIAKMPIYLLESLGEMHAYSRRIEVICYL